MFVPYTVIGAENIPTAGNFILASGHTTYFEPPLLAMRTPELMFLAKDALLKIPIFGWLIASLGTIPTLRGHFDRDGWNRAIKELQTGRTMLMFPEGYRQKDGRLGTCRAAYKYIAARAGVPVVPAYVRKPPHLWDCTFRRHRTFVVFGPVFMPESSDPDVLGDQVMSAIGELKSVADHAAFLIGL